MEEERLDFDREFRKNHTLNTALKLNQSQLSKFNRRSEFT
jgi:hypothetical protein